MFTELTVGVAIDGVRVGAGARVQSDADLGGYLVVQGWAREVGGPHKPRVGPPLLGYAARSIPGADEPLSEWPSWARPAWVRPDGRAVATGDDRAWLPVVCRACHRPAYALAASVPATTPDESGSGFKVTTCPRCRTTA